MQSIRKDCASTGVANLADGTSIDDGIAAWWRSILPINRWFFRVRIDKSWSVHSVTQFSGNECF